MTEDCAGVDVSDVGVQDLIVYSHLFELYDQMLGEVDLEKALRYTAEVVCSVLGAERATTYLVREDTQQLESIAVIGNVARTIRVPIAGDSLAGYCALTNRAFVIPDAYGDLSGIDAGLCFDRSWDERNQYRTRDVMCAPAEFKDEVWGVVQVLNSKGSPFGEADLTLLGSIARFVGYVLYHARLYEELATLKRLEKDKAQFMAILVHELRAPVSASKSLAAALRYTNRDDEQLNHVLGRIEKRMNELLLLVDDVLHLSRIKAGTPLGEIVVCDLVERTRSGCQPYLEEAAARDLDMALDLPPEPVPVRIDLQAYQLILSNLVSNAVKYTPAGCVAVALHQEAPWAVLEVKDSGMGIPEGDIPRLFSEFFRASNARRSGVEGTGVGLAGVKALVERFEGELELDSRENEGSVFTVRLPLHQTGLPRVVT